MLKKFLIVAIYFVISTTDSIAQSITLTAPSNNQTVIEGDDFATLILNNPWDFNERRDFGWEENFIGNSVVASAGVWSAVNETAGGYLFPLFGGFKGGLFAEAPTGDRSLPRFGISSPIDTNRFTHLSFRRRLSHPSTMAIYWRNKNSDSYWPDGSKRGVRYDGFFHQGKGNPASGWQIQSYNLSSLANSFSQSAGSWSGDVIALRIDPSVAAPAGATTEFDWMRLVDPNSAPIVTVRWNSANLSGASLVVLYADSDANGYNGTPLAYFPDGSDPKSFTLATALLPPGNYYFYLKSFRGSSLIEEATSNYSSRLRINQRPRGYITSPSETSGEDYAKAVRGNSWNMSDASDVANLDTLRFTDIWRQFSNPSFPNGIFQALTTPALTSIGNNEGDAQVHLAIPSTKPIDTSRYRFLSYRIAADESLHQSVASKVLDGWVSRIVFWNSDVIADAGRTTAHALYEGWHTYVVDLWSDNAGTGLVELGKQWRTFPTIRNLRIDPLETKNPTWFFFDDVKLHAQNTPTNGSFTIRWNIEDGDSTDIDATLYYQTSLAGVKKEITTLKNLNPGNYSYTWQVPSVDKTYWISIKLSDDYQSRTLTAPVEIGPTGTPTVATSSREAFADYDGDGKSDRAVFRRGTFFVERSSDAVGVAVPFAAANAAPIAIDSDGDKRTDLASVVPFGTSLLWQVSLSSNGQIVNRFWGAPGDLPVVGDFNGDGIDEIGVYRSGLWFVLYADGYVGTYTWGEAGDIPVPADFDGDGVSDVAVWRPSTGTWWIVRSKSQRAQVIQWGLGGDWPFARDFNGDGSIDLAVWRPGNGTWYIRDLKAATSEITQWGLLGDAPFVGDFNGDSLLDFSVWRASSGSWFHNFRNGQTAQQQWGLNGDRLVQ